MATRVARTASAARRRCSSVPTMRLLVLLPVVVVALAVAQPCTAAPRTFERGIAGNEGFRDADPLVRQLTLQRASAANARILRLNLVWRLIAPRSAPPADFNPANPGDPRYDWTEFDRSVRESVAAGLEP